MQIQLPITPCTVEELEALSKISEYVTKTMKSFSKLSSIKENQNNNLILENYEISLNQIGFMLQSRELLEYSGIMHKIFAGFKQVYLSLLRKENCFKINLDEIDQTAKLEINSTSNRTSQQYNTNSQGRFGGSRVNLTHYSIDGKPNFQQMSANKEDGAKSNSGTTTIGPQSFPNIANTRLMTSNELDKNTQRNLAGIQLQPDQEDILTQVLKQSQKLDVQILMKRYDPKIKLFISKGTDTDQDAIDAIKAFSKEASQRALANLLLENDDNIQEIQKALEQKSNFMLKNYSGVEDKLKGIGKALQKKSFEFEMSFADAQNKQKDQFSGGTMMEFVNYVQGAFHDIQKETYQMIMRVLKDRQHKRQKSSDFQESPSLPNKIKTSKRKSQLINSERIKILQTLDDKNEELSSKHGEINQLTVKIKELKDQTYNTDLELECMRTIQSKLEQEKSRLALEVRKLEKQLIQPVVRNTFDKETQVAFENLDASNQMMQQTSQIQFQNNEIILLQRQIWKLQEQLQQSDKSRIYNSDKQEISQSPRMVVSQNLGYDQVQIQSNLNKSTTKIFQNEIKLNQVLNQDGRPEYGMKQNVYNSTLLPIQQQKSSSNRALDQSNLLQQNGPPDRSRKISQTSQVKKQPQQDQKPKETYNSQKQIQPEKKPKDTVQTFFTPSPSPQHQNQQQYSRPGSRLTIPQVDQKITLNQTPSSDVFNQNIQKSHFNPISAQRSFQDANSSQSNHEQDPYRQLNENINENEERLGFNKVSSKANDSRSYEELDQQFKQGNFTSRIFTNNEHTQPSEADMQPLGKFLNYKGQQSNRVFDNQSTLPLAQDTFTYRGGRNKIMQNQKDAVILINDQIPYYQNQQEEEGNNDNNLQPHYSRQKQEYYDQQTESIGSSCQPSLVQLNDNNNIELKQEKQTNNRAIVKKNLISIEVQTEDFLLIEKFQQFLLKIKLPTEQMKQIQEIFNNNSIFTQSSTLQTLGKTSIIQNEQIRRLQEQQEKEELLMYLKIDSQKELQDDADLEEYQKLYNEGKPLTIIQDKDIKSEQFIQQLYKIYMQRSNNEQVLGLSLMIKKYFRKMDSDRIELQDFKDFFNKLIITHKKCGDSCIHLRRFFMRLGFISQRFLNRKQLKPFKSQLKPFTETLSKGKLTNSLAVSK